MHSFEMQAYCMDSIGKQTLDVGQWDEEGLDWPKQMSTVQRI
jgi:hypothetical protein